MRPGGGGNEACVRRIEMNRSTSHCVVRAALIHSLCEITNRSCSKFLISDRSQRSGQFCEPLSEITHDPLLRCSLSLTKNSITNLMPDFVSAQLIFFEPADFLAKTPGRLKNGVFRM